MQTLSLSKVGARLMQTVVGVPVVPEETAPLSHITGSVQQCLIVQVNDEMMGMGIEAIREILPYRDLTTVPLVPPLIRGVINLRGAVVPVIDLAVRLGRQTSAITERTCIVIVELVGNAQVPQGYKMGLVVDAVSQVLTLSQADMVPAPEFGTHLRLDFVHAMGRIGGKFVVLLDLERILWLPEIAVMGGVR